LLPSVHDPASACASPLEPVSLADVASFAASLAALESLAPSPCADASAQLPVGKQSTSV
jgi:hypothetical protein